MADRRKRAQHDRLKEALRENLKRRKAQAKGLAKRLAKSRAGRGDDRKERNSAEGNETDSESET